jgi:chaperonin GroEL
MDIFFCTELKNVSRSEHSEWTLLRVRLARLAGGIGVLKLGAQTDQARELKKEQINKTLRVLEAAYAGGLIPGGGVAFLDCLPALDAARTLCRHEDEIYGITIIEAALKASFLQIVRNHSLMHPALALETIQQHASGYGFDVLHGDFVMMAERHILDCQHVAQGALEAAASIATMLLTTNTIVFTT